MSKAEFSVAAIVRGATEPDKQFVSLFDLLQETW
jgi:hypothetical protein